MAELNLYGPVGYDDGEDGITAGKFAKLLKAVDPTEPLTIFLNSPGGSVFDGLTIYQSLVSRPGENHFVIQGVAASIASIIPMAGDTITMGQSSRMMIHNPMGPSAIAFGTATELREAADDTLKTAELLDSGRDTLVDIYAARTKMARNDITARMTAETWLTAKEAVASGFADRIQPNKSIAAAAIFKPLATAMKDADELQRTAEICRNIQLRQRKRPSTEKLNLARARLDELSVEP
jgi:ATP-dependent Clp protease protease subunit